MDLNINELLKRLKDVGVDISEKTLHRWAYEGLITGAIPQLPKERKRPGRPSFKKQEKERQIGRGSGQGFKEWSEQSFEDAVAVWIIRHPPYGLEKGEYVSDDIIRYIHREAKNLHKLLITKSQRAFAYLHKHSNLEGLAYLTSEVVD